MKKACTQPFNVAHCVVKLLNLLCDFRAPVCARRVQRSPGIRVLQVDLRPVADQDLHHAVVVVQDGLVKGRHAWKKKQYFVLDISFTSSVLLSVFFAGTILPPRLWPFPRKELLPCLQINPLSLSLLFCGPNNERVFTIHGQGKASRLEAAAYSIIFAHGDFYFFSLWPAASPCSFPFV